MRKISNLFIVVVLSSITIALTSAIPASNTPVTPEKANIALAALEKAGSDGKLTNKELNRIASDLKGEKLTLKERIGGFLLRVGFQVYLSGSQMSRATGQ